jgi:hypothetical protein
VTALDVLGLLMAALVLRAMLTDDYRIVVSDDVRLSLRSWPRLALWLAILLAIRHYAWRGAAWHRRVAAWLRRAWTWAPLRAASLPFLTSRVAMLAAGYIAVRTFGFDPPPPWRALENDWLDLFARWDAGWYFEIARRGYPDHLNPARTNAVAFFPGLPLLIRGAGTLLHVNYWFAGIVVVLLAFLWGLTYVYRLALQDMPEDQARASLGLLAFYPFAVCYSAVLTESVFLLAAAAAFYHFRRSELWPAAAFGLLAGVLRPNGFLLAAPLGLLALLPFARGRGWLPGRGGAGTPIGWPALAAQLAVAAVPVAGVALYSAYMSAQTGDPLAWVRAQQAWGRQTAGGLAVLDARLAMIDAQGFAAYLRAYVIEFVELIAALFALALTIPIIRRFGLAYGVFVAMAVLPPLLSMGPVSLGRYTAPLFPIFLWLGATISPERRPYWIALFAAGQALVAALFYTWRPPY